MSERREVLRQFANGINARNRQVHRALPASVRILGEGVDITGERGVEATCFADTRGPQVESMQNIGRALRPNPDGTTKNARIIVPVFLKSGEGPGDMCGWGEVRWGQGKTSMAFQRGVAALAQYSAREGADVPVPRGRLEPIAVEGQEEPVKHRLVV